MKTIEGDVQPDSMDYASNLAPMNNKPVVQYVYVCRECGALMLPQTWDDNNGLCNHCRWRKRIP